MTILRRRATSLCTKCHVSRGVSHTTRAVDTYLVVELLRAFLRGERKKACCKDRDGEEERADDPHVEDGVSQLRS